MKTGKTRIIIAIILIGLQIISWYGNANTSYPKSAGDYTQEFMRAEATGATALAMDIAGFAGANLALILGLILISSAFLSQWKERRHPQALLKKEERKANRKIALTEAAAKKCDLTIINFTNRISKIPSDSVIISRLSELTAGNENCRQISKNWSLANKKMSELKNTATDKVSADASVLAVEAANYFLLFLYDFDSKMEKCNEQEAAEKLRSFLADIEPLYK